MNTDTLRARLLSEPPKFHYWDGEPQAGGFGPAELLKIEGYAKAGDVWYETGAGLTTVWLLNLGVTLHSFFIQPELGESIDAFLAPYPELRARWNQHIGPSELTLPSHAIPLAEKADAFLIDGGHALQQVFCDFVYANWILKPDGLLIVDDTQLGSPKLLREMLLNGGGFYERIEDTAKTAWLRKVTRLRLLPDFGVQRALLQRLTLALSTEGHHAEA